MYSLPYFKEKDRKVLIDFVRSYPFAVVIGSTNDVPVATQLPLLLDEAEGKLTLRGHLMKGSDHHQSFLQNSNVLCIFTGPHVYVSASWYSNPQTGSTWNYMSVHAAGTIRFLPEPELLKILDRTTALFENNENSTALFRHLPKPYVDSLAKMIVGFEVEVERLENVFKLSQNRDEESYDNIIRHLQMKGGDSRTIGEEMRKRREQVFQR